MIETRTNGLIVTTLEHSRNWSDGKYNNVTITSDGLTGQVEHLFRTHGEFKPITLQQFLNNERDGMVDMFEIGISTGTILGVIGHQQALLTEMKQYAQTLLDEKTPQEAT